MKKRNDKLRLKIETLQILAGRQLDDVNGRSASPSEIAGGCGPAGAGAPKQH